MKLVDILARHMSVWAHGVKTISQSANGELRDEANYFLTEKLPEFADDGLHQQVTHAQWQAAVDALKAAPIQIIGDLPKPGWIVPEKTADLITNGWLESPSLFTQHIGRINRKLPEWNGEGLPPVGTVCEWKHVASETWHQAKVNYIGCAYVIFANHAGDDEQHYYRRDISFRPIREPEEIIDTERESAIKAFMKIGDIYYCDAEKLYDAGARLSGEGKKA